MGVLSWLNVRPRTLVGASIVGVAAIGITTMAVAYEGNPTTELDLHDGSVWITKTDKQWVGHFNAESRLLDGKLGAPTADYDILQDDDVALVHDFGDSSVGRIDAAAMSLPNSAKLPAKALVEYANETVAILDPAKGDLFVVPLAGLSSFEPGKADPVLEKLGEKTAITVGRDGTVYAASPDKATLYTLPVTPEGAAIPDQIAKLKLEGLTKDSELAVTSVGERPAVLERDSGVITIPGRESYTLEEPEEAQLAQDAADGDSLIVATRSSLLSVPFDGSEPKATDSGATSGLPAAPVWLNGCAYSAWMGSGLFVRDCVGEENDLPSRAIEKYKGGQLVFRVNRDVVMLNDVVSGGAWLASDALQKVDNWDDLTPPKGDGSENPNPTTVEVPDPTPPDRGKENTPPVATDDIFGVRAGTSTILPVLTGYAAGAQGGTAGADSDPDGDVLVVSLPDGKPSGVESLETIDNESALQITLAPGTTSVPDFAYEISDGRPGGTATANVHIDVTGEGDNTAPRQLRKIAVPVETGSDVTYNVLPDWLDPDGDSIYLESVGTPEGDAVRFTADGRITFSALSQNLGPIEIPITVSDGTASTAGALAIEVFPQSSKPPLSTADHLVVREGQLGTVAPLANDLSASNEPLQLARVSEVEGAEIVPDLTDGTFTFQSSKAGTYYVDYLVTTSGTTPVPGLVRVDVKPREDATDAPPVAVRDVALLPAGGDVRVNVLANDTDPAGGVVILQGLEVPEGSGISASVEHNETVRIADAGLGARGLTQVKIAYTISNGQQSATGELVVLPMPAPEDVLPPVLAEDEAEVRVGDVVTIPVLDNDYHPNDLDMFVRPDLGSGWEDAGDAFVAQRKYVRFRAGDQPGDVRFTYFVEDENGQVEDTSVVVHVRPIDAENNNKPRPQTVEARTVEGTDVSVEIPLDGIDPDGDSVEYVGLVSPAKKGRFGPDENGTLVYRPNSGALGLDTFTYRVRDALGAIAQGTIRIGIAPKPKVNQAPFAGRDSLVMRPGRVVEAKVLANDIDPEGGKPFLVDEKDSLVLAEDAPIEAEVLEDRVVVTAPDEELETSLQYTIEDREGARALGVLQITVDEDAPEQPPIARDDFVLTEKIEQDQTMTLDLTRNDEDPDGSRDDFTVELLDADKDVELKGSTATVTVLEKRRLVEYQITDLDGKTAKAFIHVPGQEDLRPNLKPTTEPATVKSGETIELKLSDYVQGAGDKQVRLTSAETVTASHSNGASLVVDEFTLTYTSETRFWGSDAISFEVTDGTSADDPAGRKSILSIPIRVTPPDNEPPVMTGAAVKVGAGDSDPGRVELAGLATDIDQDPISFQVQSQPDGIQARIEGTTLLVTADAEAKGTKGDVVVVADDGKDNPNHPEPVTAPVTVTVTASTRAMPVATDDRFPEWNQGETKQVDVLKNDTNPFKGEAPLEVVDAEFEVGDMSDADLRFTASALTITPDKSFHGRLVIRYTIQDKTKDPDRTAQARVLVTVQGVPDAPLKPRVSHVESHQLTLSWDAPADNGAQITGYKVTSVKGEPYEKNCTQTTCVLDGLTNNVTYAFTVTAINKVGSSKASPVSQEGRPDVRPETPVAPEVPEFGDSSLTVTWKRPHTDGSPVTWYELKIQPATPSGQPSFRIDDTGATITRTITGLQNGTPYRFSVVAHNSAPEASEDSAWSATNTPAKPPAAPAAPTTRRQSSIGATPGAIEVNWVAITGSAAGGDAVDLYEVQAFRGGAPLGKPKQTSGTTAVFSLGASTEGYTFQVRAKNKAGWGEPSPQSAPLRQFTSPTAPGTPVVAADPHDQSMSFSWTPATAQGADEIHYKYLLNDGRGWVDVGTATSATVTGLQNGTGYTAQVQAYSVAGGESSEPGPASGTSAAFVPYGAPFAPGVSGSVSGGQGRQVSFSWSVPGQNGRPYTALKYRIDGGGVQTVSPTNGSWGPQQFDYSTTHTIEAWMVDDLGQESAHASKSVKTDAEPKPDPSGSVSYVPTSEANPNGTVDGCNYTCKYLKLTYNNLPDGNYGMSCQENKGGWRTFSTESHHISNGSGSIRLDCAYGYSNDVRVVVDGPGGSDFIAN